MKQNVLHINIQRPKSDVFSFTIDPHNTPRWISTIEIEETNEWPMKKGTIYRNRDREGAWSEYVVSEVRENELFELVAKDGNYHVRYSYTESPEGMTTMEYREWMIQGNLQNPFSQATLETLRALLDQ